MSQGEGGEETEIKVEVGVTAKVTVRVRVALSRAASNRVQPRIGLGVRLLVYSCCVQNS